MLYLKKFAKLHFKYVFCVPTLRYNHTQQHKSKYEPTFRDFLAQQRSKNTVAVDVEPNFVPYLSTEKQPKTVYIETYGCQMNASDTEIVLSILKSANISQINDYKNADIILLNTCSIRENAEHRVFTRLEDFKHLRTRGRKPIVGILGCMAERLKTKLLEHKNLVDLVAGPDSYRDLPHLLNMADEGQAAVNVMLSADETYADIAPVRTSSNQVSAFVSIMRGCNNMCSYCIVPFTRGRERSRPVESIEREVRELSKMGYKEITLLGQNVNSYDDRSAEAETGAGLNPDGTPALSNSGFKTIYKLKKGGIRFTELVDRLSKIDPEMRIRFTSPHPKDFPEDLLKLISERPNVCNAIHIPAQSGNSNVLERMRRGYTREAYLNLVSKMREIIPGVSLSTDIIAGFCGETEEEHKDTLSLMEIVKYDQAFMFAYSLREKTWAHRTMKDDVPEEVKKRRLAEIIELFNKYRLEANKKEIGKLHLILIDGTSRRSQDDLVGRTDTNKKVIIKANSLPDLKPGDYVAVKVTHLKGHTLIGEPICKSSIADFYSNMHIYANR